MRRFLAVLLMATAVVVAGSSEPSGAIPAELSLSTPASIVSVDASGRYVVLKGGGSTLYRVDRLKSSMTLLPPLLAVNADGWFGITADRRWLDMRSQTSVPAPAALSYVMSGDGSAYVANDEDGHGSTYVVGATGETTPISSEGRAVAVSTDGQYVLLKGCPGGPACADMYLRWSRTTGNQSQLGSPTATFAPAIADDGRVVEQQYDVAADTIRLIVREVGGGQKVFEQARVPIKDTPKAGEFVSLSANGKFLAFSYRWTSCCASAYVLDVETGSTVHVVNWAMYFPSPGQSGGAIGISGSGSTVLTVRSARLDEGDDNMRLSSQTIESASPVGRLQAGEIHELPVAGIGGVGADASSVMLNVTVTNPLSAGYVTVWPCGQPVPLASNGNFVAGQTVANAVLASVGANGKVCVTSNSRLDLIVDVQGWFGASSPYHTLTPRRIADTRGAADGPASVPQGATAEVPVAGVGSDASSVMLNVTVTNPVSAGYVTVWPCGQPVPLASNGNFVAGQTVANAVLASVGANGKVCVTSNSQLDLIVDVQGWFGPSSPYHALTPTRLSDTRGAADGPASVPQGATVEVPVTGVAGVGADASSVMLNVTVTNPVSAGYVTVWPCGQPVPLASNGNFVAGQTVANAVLASVGANGKVCVTSNSQLDVIVDVQGWFGPSSPYHALTPVRVDDTRG